MWLWRWVRRPQFPTTRTGGKKRAVHCGLFVCEASPSRRERRVWKRHVIHKRRECSMSQLNQPRTEIL
jgi:hypothetical protein